MSGVTHKPDLHKPDFHWYTVILVWSPLPLMCALITVLPAESVLIFGAGWSNFVAIVSLGSEYRELRSTADSGQTAAWVLAPWFIIVAVLAWDIGKLSHGAGWILWVVFIVMVGLIPIGFTAIFKWSKKLPQDKDETKEEIKNGAPSGPTNERSTDGDSIDYGFNPAWWSASALGMVLLMVFFAREIPKIDVSRCWFIAILVIWLLLVFRIAMKLREQKLIGIHVCHRSPEKGSGRQQAFARFILGGAVWLLDLSNRMLDWLRRRGRDQGEAALRSEFDAADSLPFHYICFPLLSLILGMLLVIVFMILWPVKDSYVIDRAHAWVHLFGIAALYVSVDLVLVGKYHKLNDHSKVKMYSEFAFYDTILFVCGISFVWLAWKANLPIRDELDKAKIGLELVAAATILILWNIVYVHLYPKKLATEAASVNMDRKATQP